MCPSRIHHSSFFRLKTSPRLSAQVCIQRLGSRTEFVEDRNVSHHSIFYPPKTLKHHPSHLNLIRSVTTILEIMSRVMKEQQDRLQRQQRSLSPSRSFRSVISSTLPSSQENGHSDDDAREVTYDFSDKHKLLQLQLQPLTRVQSDLEKYLGPATLEPDQVPTTENTAFPDFEGGGPSHRRTEFSVSINSPWKTRLLGREAIPKPAERKHTQDLNDATEILHRCGSDIKLLWTDNVVQQVLTETKTQLKHSSGLSVTDRSLHLPCRLT